MKWVISVGGYGHFMFEGTERQAEKTRVSKAIWEMAIARKRLADEYELQSGIVNECKNHPNFNTKNNYQCKCMVCMKKKNKWGGNRPGAGAKKKKKAEKKEPTKVMRIPVSKVAAVNRFILVSREISTDRPTAWMYRNDVHTVCSFLSS